jgi:hypothetical protein
MIGPATAPIWIQSSARLRSERPVSRAVIACSAGVPPHVVDDDVHLGGSRRQHRCGRLEVAGPCHHLVRACAVKASSRSRSRPPATTRPAPSRLATWKARLPAGTATWRPTSAARVAPIRRQRTDLARFATTVVLTCARERDIRL